MDTALPLSVAIPTYRRETVLLDTLAAMLALRPRAFEVLVLDQTETHLPVTEAALHSLAGTGQIRWLRLPQPSVTIAMNEGLKQATQDLVLFVDDDVRPGADLLVAHVAAHAHHPDGLVAGRVIQPWQEYADINAEDPFTFASSRPATVREFIGCNFSVRRKEAIALGGFDENFVRVAYRYEAEFASRYRAQGRSIHFEPRACLHHLKAEAGGTRTFGDHLTSWRPDHAVGAYYHGLRTGRMREFLERPYRAVATRYHFRHPWRVPGTLLAELTGMCWALALFLRGPRYVRTETGKTPE